MNNNADIHKPHAIHLDEKAWYQQFWPWFLIILPATVVIASICTVFIAFKGADVVVADNYYKEGLAINTSFSESRLAKEHNISAELQFSSDQLLLTVNANNVTPADELSLHFKHPFDNAQDSVIILKKYSNNTYLTTAPILNQGKWYISIQPHSVQKSWRLDATVFLPKTTLLIKPE